MFRALLFCALAPVRGISAEETGLQSVAIGSRVEMFVDPWLVDAARTNGASLKLL
jgi:hypothetical protein